MQKLKIISIFSIAALIGVSSFMLNADDKMKDEGKTTEQTAEQERCTVPGYAIAIGHEELWKKHNGCAAEEKKADE